MRILSIIVVAPVTVGRPIDENIRAAIARIGPSSLIRTGPRTGSWARHWPSSRHDVIFG